MEKMQDLKALLTHEIEDLVSAEDQIIEAMPVMIEKAKNSSLKKALRNHLQQTKAQRKRLDKVQKLLGASHESAEESKGLFSKLFGGITRHECKGMKGILEEGEKVMSADMVAAVKDAAIIASAQKVEHYEICGYGTARSYAKELGLAEVARLLEETLNEEYDTDRLLTTLAEGDINLKAEGKKTTVKLAKSSGATAVSRAGSSVNATKKASTKAASKSPVKKAPAKSVTKKVATKSAKK